MNRYTQFALLSASTLRMLPHIALYLLHRKEIDADLEKYQDQRGGVVNFIKVCTRERVYRNLFYYRMGDYRSVFIKKKASASFIASSGTVFATLYMSAVFAMWTISGLSDGLPLAA